MTRTIITLAAIALAACTAKLEDGVYGCRMDDQCPDGWFCHSARLCYAFPEVVDRGTFGTPCANNGECLEGYCDLGPPSDPWGMGFCSVRCSPGGMECAGGGGCSEYGSCVLTCGGGVAVEGGPVVGVECPAGTTCGGFGILGIPVGRCYPSVADIPPVAHTLCMSSEDCPAAVCALINGIYACARPCASDGSIVCQVGEECFIGDEGFEICRVPCTDPSQCGGVMATQCIPIGPEPIPAFCAP